VNINNNNSQIESSTVIIPIQQQQQQQQSKVSSSDSIDIMQMLAKAQNSYVQSKTSDVTDQPKPIGYHLNSNTYLKPEAIRIQPTSPKSSQQQEQQPTKSQPINPIIQRLLSYDPINTTTTTTITPSASTSTLAQDNSFNIENNNELLSLEIKRKLNIIKLPSDDNAAPHQKSINNIFSPSNSTKHLMTVKDFEANILGTESNDQPPSVNKHQMFYLEQTTTHRPTKLQLFNENSNVSSKLKHISSSNVILIPPPKKNLIIFF
jgi:hypothetical protein